MKHDVRIYMGYLWYQKEDDYILLGLHEDAFEDFSEVESFDLPAENDSVEEDAICGTIETDEGPLDIYSPISGKVIEINTSVIDDPSIVKEDPYGEGWILKIQAEDIDDDDEDEDDDEDDYEDEDEEED